MGYVAPEFFSNPSHKIDASADVFSFGVLALEVVSGKVPGGEDDIILQVAVHYSFLSKYSLSPKWTHFQAKQAISTKTLQGFLDPKLLGDYNMEEAERILKVGILCTNSKPQNRPKMDDVLKMLEGVEDIPSGRGHEN